MSGKHKRIPRDRILRDYWELARPVDEIWREYGYADKTTFYDLLERYGIPLRGRNILAHQPLTERQLHIVAGTILGDGHLGLRKGGVHYSLHIAHSQSQLQYVQWLDAEFSPFSTGVHLRPSYNGGKSSPTCSTYVIAHPDLSRIALTCYRDKKKVVTGELLKFALSPVSLAVWLMDDGSFVHRGKTSCLITMATHGFTHDEVVLLSGWLRAEFGISSYVHVHRLRGKEYWKLDLPPQDTRKFASLVSPHIVPDMRYKIGC